VLSGLVLAVWVVGHVALSMCALFALRPRECDLDQSRSPLKFAIFAIERRQE
jgi:hypothetical protein